jgi:hypothetical protein
MADGTKVCATVGHSTNIVSKKFGNDISMNKKLFVKMYFVPETRPAI